MKYWTVQSIDVLHTIQDKGIYFPDFRRSSYLKGIPALQDLYYHFLNSFNAINYIDPTETTGQGLVFGFFEHAYDTRKQADCHLNSAADFRQFLVENKDVISSLWRTLSEDPENKVLIELEFDEPFFNPLLIDINDFQFLMPPLTYVPPFTKEDARRIVTDIQSGLLPESIFPGGLLQAHLPFIKASDIRGVYNVFSID